MMSAPHAAPPGPQKIIGGGRNILNRHERSFKRGTLMFIEGEVSSEMFIIRSGKIRILKQEGQSTIELATLGPGSVIGELSLLDHQPRSATAQITEDTLVTVIDEQLLQSTLTKIPNWMADIIRLVVKRLRDTMKRTGDDIIRKSVAGVIRVILLAGHNIGFMHQERQNIALDRLKDMVYAVIGLGSIECENVLLHLIFKDMILIRKDESGQEFLIVKDSAVLLLYLNYLRAKQRGGAMVGEDLSDGALELISQITAAGSKNGSRLRDKVIKIGCPQVELEIERRQKGRFIDRDALDKLVASKVIVLEEDKTETQHGTYKRAAIIYNEDTLQKLHLFRQWLPTFKEDIQL